jgi:tetratricopeptide (TPR) repeat protein
MGRMNKIQNILEAEKLFKKGNVAGATEQYIEFIRQHPADVTAINALGDLYVRTGKIDEAVKEFLTVADIYERKNAASLVIAMLKKVLKWSPQNEVATRRLADSYARQAHEAQLCQPEQRRATRIKLSLPMQVHCKDRGWQEQTESLDVSPLGVKSPLTHHVEPGRRLQLEMPMPENLRIYKIGKAVYEVEAYVCRILAANDGKIVVGAEFGAIV